MVAPANEASLDLHAWQVDEHGHLLDWRSWTPAFATLKAAQDGHTLSPEHWEILDFLRAYYDAYAMAPPIRLLTKAVSAKLGPEKGNSRYLYRLFPDGPGKQGSCWAGLPKPISCI